jgi:hypothetical protein
MSTTNSNDIDSSFIESVCRVCTLIPCVLIVILYASEIARAIYSAKTPHAANPRTLVPRVPVLSAEVVRRESPNSLMRLFNPADSDKQSGHSYLQLYQHLFETKRSMAKNVMEIGICRGGSIVMWHSYFENAIVWGLDIMKKLPPAVTPILNSPRAKLLYGHDAYDESWVNKTFADPNFALDIFIDDGPHSLASMKAAVRLYLPLLAERGIFVIEDVQHPSWLRELKAVTPKEDHKYIHTYDMSATKGRSDDIVFMVNREVY